MKVYFRPTDAYASVQRDWEAALAESDVEAVAFYREGSTRWRGLRAPWSIKFVLGGSITMHLPDGDLELEAGSCLAVAADVPYSATVRDARYVSLFGSRLFQRLFPESEDDSIAVFGKFHLEDDNLRALERFAAMAARFEGAAAVDGGNAEAPRDGHHTVVPSSRLPLLDAVPAELRELQARTNEFVAGKPRRLSLARRLLAARQALDVGYARPGACSTAAERACLTRSQFSRQFSALIGCSPREHVNRVRTRAALKLLAVGTESVAEIARELGYRHASSLSHFFQRHDLPAPRAVAAAGRAQTG